MKVKQSIVSRLLGILAMVLAAVAGMTSCTDPETTDKTDFALYYYGMTDIGPGQSGNIAQPSYKGAAPSDFAIVGVTLDGAPYSGDAFMINAATGAISVTSTSEMQVGTYQISVSCVAGGNTYTFNDIVTVNFLKAVPEGITVEPSTLQAEYGDIIDVAGAELPTAQVTTEKDHITITSYAISAVRKDGNVVDNKQDPKFAISKEGVISIVKGCQSIEPGVYVLDLKLTTALAGSDSEDGIFQNALEVKVTSKPLALTYLEGKLEEAGEEAGDTEFKSAAPVLKGSAEGVAYSIENVTSSNGGDAKDKFAIDAATGIISVAKGHGFKVGEKYAVDVRVKNAYSEEGVLFENAFTLTVVDYIEPISGFSYPATSVTELVAFAVKPSVSGADPRFEFVNLDAKYNGVLSLDATTGEVSAQKGHTLTIGEHRIRIKASNDKNSDEQELVLTVGANPNKFTFFTYGNNLGIDQMTNASQFRFRSQSELSGKTLPVVSSDLPEGKKVTWKIVNKNAAKSISINKTDGTLTLSADTWAAAKVGVAFVTATVGESEDDPASISVTLPIFFHCSAAGEQGKKEQDELLVEYTPFVLHVHPQRGGRSEAPVIKNADGSAASVDLSKLNMDYARSCNYYNLNGVRSDGTALEDNAPDAKTAPSAFMQNLWREVYGTSSYGSKDPVSYFANITDLTKALCYVDNTSGASGKYALVVNPGKWYDDGWADGIFHGQITYVTDGDTNSANIKNNGVRIFPIVVWFDKSLK